MVRVDAAQLLRGCGQRFLQRLGLLLFLFRGVRVRRRVVARVADVQDLLRDPILVARAVEDLCGKFNLCFNSGSLSLVMRCCSLQSVECISRRSCPSLGLSDDRGAEIARNASRRWRGLDDALRRRRREDKRTHRLLSTQVHGGGPCISRKTKEITSPPACGPGQEAVSRLQRFGRMCISKQRRIARF